MSDKSEERMLGNFCTNVPLLLLEVLSTQLIVFVIEKKE